MIALSDNFLMKLHFHDVLSFLSVVNQPTKLCLERGSLSSWLCRPRTSQLALLSWWLPPRSRQGLGVKNSRALKCLPSQVNRLLLVQHRQAVPPLCFSSVDCCETMTHFSFSPFLSPSFSVPHSSFLLVSEATGQVVASAQTGSEMKSEGELLCHSVPFCTYHAWRKQI